MKWNHSLVLAFSFFLLACQPTTAPTVTIIDNKQIVTLQTNERVPSALLNQAGITINPNDRLLLNGIPTALDEPITNYPITLQLRRAIPIIISSPDGEKQIQSSAFTIGEALQEASIWLRAGDKITPDLNSPILRLGSGQISNSPITIYQLPSHELTITSNGKTTSTLSSTSTVGEALAEAGIPLVG